MKFVSNVNWTGLWWIVGIVLVLWTGLVTLLPPEIYKPVAVVLAAVQSALLFAARGGKYVENRQEPPPNGRP